MVERQSDEQIWLPTLAGAALLLAACGSRSALDVGEQWATGGGGTQGSGGLTSSGGLPSSGGTASGGSPNDPSCRTQTDRFSSAWGGPRLRDFTGLTLAGGTLAVSYNLNDGEDLVPSWAAIRDDSFALLPLGLSLPGGRPWLAKGVAIDNADQVWGALEPASPGSGSAWLLRLDPSSADPIILSGERVLELATDDFGFAYVLSELSDGVREVAQIELATGEVTMKVTPVEAANLVALGASRSGYFAVAHVGLEPGTALERWEVSAFAPDRNLLWQRGLGCRTGMVALSVDESGNVYAVGPSTCELEGTGPLDIEPPWETLPRSPMSPTLVQKLSADGRFAWAAQIGDLDYRAEFIDIDIDRVGPVFLQKASGFEGDLRYDSFQLDTEGRLVWSTNHCGKPARLASDGKCTLYLGGDQGCDADSYTSLVQKFEPKGP